VSDHSVRADSGNEGGSGAEVRCQAGARQVPGGCQAGARQVPGTVVCPAGAATISSATAGITVLMLEAGRLVDPSREYRTMEWP